MGGILTGHFGDRHGRKLLFMLTIAGMSLSTLGIGLLPDYSQWGIYSVYLLVLLKVIQGICLGGELPGSTTYAAEHVESSRRGLVTSIVIGSVTFGNVLGAGLGWWLTRIISEVDMQAWGWRIPFYIGGGLGILGFIARGRIEESPVFSKMLESRAGSGASYKAVNGLLAASRLWYCHRISNCLNDYGLVVFAQLF